MATEEKKEKKITRKRKAPSKKKSISKKTTTENTAPKKRGRPRKKVEVELTKEDDLEKALKEISAKEHSSEVKAEESEEETPKPEQIPVEVQPEEKASEEPSTENKDETKEEAKKTKEEPSIAETLLEINNTLSKLTGIIESGQIDVSAFIVNLSRFLMPRKKEKPSDILLKEIRTTLGQAIETVQCIEFNLSLLLMYESIEKDVKECHNHHVPLTPKKIKAIFAKGERISKDVSDYTFGSLIAELSTTGLLPKKDLDELKDLLDTRNYLVHKYFKTQNFEAQIKNEVFLNDKFNELTRYSNRVSNFNQMLTKKMNEKAERINKLINDAK